MPSKEGVKRLAKSLAGRMFGDENDEEDIELAKKKLKKFKGDASVVGEYLVDKSFAPREALADTLMGYKYGEVLVKPKIGNKKDYGGW